MSSWVRYCVAVYVGLLISGALVQPAWVPAYPRGAEVLPTLPEASAPLPAEPAPDARHAPPGHEAHDRPARSATLAS